MLSRTAASTILRMASTKSTSAAPLKMAKKVGRGLPRVSQPFSTFKHELNLPRLPVPPLQQTMEKYLKSVKPLLAENEFEHTKDVVDDFRKPGGVGEELQGKLVGRSQKYENWLAEWWDDVAYFSYQNPVVVYSSPGVAYPKQKFNSEMDQLRYSAKAIRAVLGFKALIDSESLPVDMAGNDPQTMVQYGSLLSNCRIPHGVKDFARKTPAHKSRHIIVMCKNQAFEMNVYNNKEPLSEADLVNGLKSIKEMATGIEEEFPVGVLTSTDRRTWARNFKRLQRDSLNKRSLDTIIKSVFVLCLDDACETLPADSSVCEDLDMSITANHVLHGRGSDMGSCNRWFDKIFQLIVSEDGYVGCCYEHSSAEAPPVQMLSNHIISRCTLEDAQTFYHNNESNKDQPKRLEWRLTEDIKDRIDEAKDGIDQLVDDVDMRMLRYEGCGKNFPKANKMSPDAFIQMGLQLAFHKLHGHMPPTYESASTKKFRLGRTDTIRSASLACKEFCEAMASADKTVSERRELFIKAIQDHSKYTKEAINGQAIDRHLLGLKLVCMESGIKLPEIFRDKGYNYGFYFKLSTSQVPSPFETVVCYGAAVPNGYGVCYNPLEDHFNFAVSAFNSNPETNTKHFAESLKSSFDEIQKLFSQSKL